MLGQVCDKTKNYFLSRYFDQRASTASLPMRDRSFAVNFFARAMPPFDAPSLLSATAAGFFFFCDVGGMNQKYSVSK